MNFNGSLVPSHQILQYDFTSKNVAIIGVDQSTVEHLKQICDVAKSVYVHQIAPHFLLPQTEKGINRLINHPLLVRNRRLFSNRVKVLLALRFLESQVSDLWLRRQLTPNTVKLPKNFLKSDSYYRAIQRENCKLVTWPIQKISAFSIHSIDGFTYNPDIIITTF